jgi:hypothetical protein
MVLAKGGFRWLAVGSVVVLLHIVLFWVLAAAGFAPRIVEDAPPVELWLHPAGGGWPRLSASPSTSPHAASAAASPPVERRAAPATPAEAVASSPEAEQARAQAASSVSADAQPAAAPSAVPGLRGEGLGRFGAGYGRRVRRVFWLRDLTVEEARAVYPPEGLARRLNGVVRLSCVLREDDRIGGCMILSESPERMGFGPAAIAASRLRGVRGEDAEGRPRLNERIVLEMRFDGMGGGGVSTPER